MLYVATYPIPLQLIIQECVLYELKFDVNLYLFFVVRCYTMESWAHPLFSCIHLLPAMVSYALIQLQKATHLSSCTVLMHWFWVKRNHVLPIQFTAAFIQLVEFRYDLSFIIIIVVVVLVIVVVVTIQRKIALKIKLTLSKRRVKT